MDDVFTIRRTNLKKLCEDRQNNQSQLARDIGVAPSLINRYITGEKPVGEDMARKSEGALKLDFGWMDNVHQTDRESALLRAFRAASDDTKRTIERGLGIHFQAPSPRTAAELEEA